MYSNIASVIDGSQRSYAPTSGSRMLSEYDADLLLMDSVRHVKLRTSTLLQTPIEKLRRRAEGFQPAAVEQELVRLVGEYELAEIDPLRA
jgi:hypothetical protein